MRMLAKFTSLFLILFVAPATSSAAGWVAHSYIEELYVVSTGTVHVLFEDSSGNESCVYGDTWKSVKFDNDALSAFYSMLLAARTTKLKISYYIDSCYLNYPVITRLKLEEFVAP